MCLNFKNISGYKLCFRSCAKMAQSTKISRCHHVKYIGDISWEEIKEKQEVNNPCYLRIVHFSSVILLHLFY